MRKRRGEGERNAYEIERIAYTKRIRRSPICKKKVLRQYPSKQKIGRRIEESEPYLPIHPHQEDPAEHEPSEETRRNVTCVCAAISLVLHVGYAPPAEGDLCAYVYEREEGKQVKLLDAQDLLVFVRGRRLGVGADTSLRQDLYLH